MVASDFAMAAPFVATDKEKQNKLQRPLGQRRDNYLKKGTQVLDLMVDSAASMHLAPAGTVLRLATDVETKNGPFIATADATARQMQVSNNGDFNARVKVEKGHYKGAAFNFKGAEGMDECLLSVAALIKDGAEVRFALPDKGGCKMRLADSEEWVPIDFVAATHRSSNQASYQADARAKLYYALCDRTFKFQIAGKDCGKQPGAQFCLASQRQFWR